MTTVANKPDIEVLRKEFKIFTMDVLKRTMIQRAMAAANGNKALASELMGVNYRTFRTWTKGSK
jgi:DNA-binding protein Fis